MCQQSELIRSFISKAKERYPAYSYGYEINREGTYRIWHTNPDESSDERFQMTVSELMYDLLTLNGFDDYYLNFNPDAYNSHCLVETIKNLHLTSSEFDRPTFSPISHVKTSCDNELVSDRNYWIAKSERPKETEPFMLAA